MFPWLQQTTPIATPTPSSTNIPSALPSRVGMDVKIIVDGQNALNHTLDIQLGEAASFRS
jgi:hypothetical protein